MPAATPCIKHTKIVLVSLLALITFHCNAQNISLANAYAHNDYWHKRPLYDALDNGFTHIEADVYLRNGKMIVAHILPMLNKHKTLQSLYLDPLMACFNGAGQVTCPQGPVMLMIDIKSEANSTYQALEAIFAHYRSMLSGYENGVFIQRQVTIVITGHKPVDMVRSQPNRVAFIDDDLLKVQSDTLSVNLYQTASCRYSRIISWNGNGQFPKTEHAVLCHYIMAAHKLGAKVRLWGSPENPVVWDELLQCGVDLINTDKLPELKAFLTKRLALTAALK